MSKKTKKNIPVLPGEPERSPSDLSDKLEFEELTRGVIRIDDSIDEFNTSDYMRKIGYVVNKGIKTIKFLITSPGGSVYHALALYDRLVSLKNIGVKTEAYVEGMAASAASMIVLQGVQKRFATANSRFLIHEPRRWTMFNMERTSDMQDSTKEMSAISDIIYSLMAKRCKISKQNLINMINRRESWLSATEAKKIGLIDGIVQ